MKMYYSNCLIEALRLKLRHWNKVRLGVTRVKGLHQLWWRGYMKVYWKFYE